MDQKILDTLGGGVRAEFKQLSEELKSLAPYRDNRGRLQFRRLNAGERPLNRTMRRALALQLVCGAQPQEG